MTSTNHPLLTSERIGLIGDVDGDVAMLNICLDRLANRGCEAVVQLGNLGLVWPDDNMDDVLEELDLRLERERQVLYFVDGTRDDHVQLNALPVASDGVRWARPRVAHLPRAWRGTHSTGLVFGALGGASSVDMANREPGVDWWPEENIREEELEVLGWDDGGKFQQHYRHRSDEWNQAHKYGRQTVEAYNRSLKDRSQGGSGDADSRRLRGVTAQSFLVLLGVIATNLRRTDRFLAEVEGLYGRKPVAAEARHRNKRTSATFADPTRTRHFTEARGQVNPAARTRSRA